MPILLRALSLAPHAKDWLEFSHDPRILHVFDCACNLINECGEVLSIVTRQIGNGPFNLVVENEVHFFDELNLESLVSISSTQLTLGNLNIHITNTNLWNPRPDWEMLNTKADEILHQIKQLPITNYQKHDISPIPQSLISTLPSALANADVFSSRRISSQLAGLGIGLTPSGDDFLMGAMYAAWIIHPPEVASILAREIANTAIPLTTSLSAAWLRSAAKGEAGIRWHDFFDALVSTSVLRVHETMKDILAIGETSGADALAGFTGVFVSWMKKTGSLHE